MEPYSTKHRSNHPFNPRLFLPCSSPRCWTAIMATGSDVRDILSLPQQGSSQPSSLPRSQQHQHQQRKKKKPKMDGISRELYALLGDNTPSLTFSQAGLGGDVGTSGSGKGKFMPKFKKRPQKVQGWKSAPFTNPARKDGLTLRHWIPASEAEEEKYRFANLNTSSGVYTYSNDEYHQHLRDDDWTKEETDYLIDLCQQYDLRFVIVTDRYDWPGRERSMEDLKARYYAICRRLIRSRISTDDMEARSQLVLTYSFDRAREVERKRHVARLFSRTPQQLAEEEALYVEARRLEQNESKFATEREELLRLLGGWERVPNVRSESVAAAGSGVGVLQEAAEEALEAARRSKKRKAGNEGSTAPEDNAASTSRIALGATAAAGSSSSTTPLSAKQKAELRNAQFDEVHNITRFDPQSNIGLSAKPPYPYLTGTPSTYPPVAPSLNNASSSHGVYLRSTRMLTPKSNLLQRTQEAMAELQPPVSIRLCFPTKENCEKWEGVVGAITSGLEMKRQLDRVQSELRVAQLRLQSGTPSVSISATQPAPPAPTSTTTQTLQEIGADSMIDTTADTNDSSIME
jgi:DNA methyltransferase 1-associated protein 1